MHRLVFGMVGIGQEHRGQNVEGQLVVGLRIVDRLRLRGLGRKLA